MRCRPHYLCMVFRRAQAVCADCIAVPRQIDLLVSCAAARRMYVDSREALVQDTRSHIAMTCASCLLYDCSCFQRGGICGAVWSMPGTPSRWVCAHERCG